MSWRRGYVPDRKLWRAVREEVLERDNWTCQMCGGWGDECDHITPMKDLENGDVYDIMNLQILCRDCHIQKTRIENRRYKIKTWQEFGLKD